MTSVGVGIVDCIPNEKIFSGVNATPSKGARLMSMPLLCEKAGTTPRQSSSPQTLPASRPLKSKE
jgi:hypothetical protein